MHRNLRYAILLDSILLFVAVNEAVIKMRSTSWERPLEVHIYAVSGDGRAASEAYVDSLTTEHFKPIEKFVNREAKRYGITDEAIEVEYHGRLNRIRRSRRRDRACWKTSGGACVSGPGPGIVAGPATMIMATSNCLSATTIPRPRLHCAIRLACRVD